MHVLNNSLLVFMYGFTLVYRRVATIVIFQVQLIIFYSIWIYEIVYLEKSTPFSTLEYVSIHHYYYSTLSSHTFPLIGVQFN